MIDVTTITVAQFKAQFSRTFPYLPVYDASAVYNTGDETYYGTNNLFYNSQIDLNTGITPGSDTSKWAKAIDTLDNWVQDADITNAFAEAQATFPGNIYPTDGITTLAYLYLAAHFLAYDLKAALAGIMASGSFPVSARAAGSVSESYSVPKAYQDDPILSGLSTTAYGLKFCQLTLPYLVGNVHAVHGHANP